MRPPMASTPPPVPVKVLRAECLFQCPKCLSGVGFLKADPMEPGQGCQVRCPSCKLLLGFRCDFVKLDEPKVLIG